MINDYLDSVSIVELNVLYITVGPTENGHGWVGDKWARTNVGRIKGVNMYALPHLQICSKNRVVRAKNRTMVGLGCFLGWRFCLRGPILRTTVPLGPAAGDTLQPNMDTCRLQQIRPPTNGTSHACATTHRPYESSYKTCRLYLRLKLNEPETNICICWQNNSYVIKIKCWY
jgi:hypothetical protein